MPQAKLHNHFAALTFELVPGADGVTTEAHLLPPGPFRSTDTRPVECKAWQMDAKIAAKVIARMAAQKNDTLIDFEHQSLHAATNGQKVLAAGWIPKTLEWRDGKGLYAVGITWVGDTAALVASKQIRYTSTVFSYDPKTGDVVEIISVALTNTPALDGLEALADLSRKFYQPEENLMDKDLQIATLTAERETNKTQLAALTKENEGHKTQVAALTTERDGLAVKVAAIEKEKVEAALTAEKAKHGEVLQAALTAGIVTPALKLWAEKQSLAALTEFVESSKPLALLSKQADGKDVTETAHGLTEIQLAACTKMGVTPEEYVKANKTK